MADGFVFYASFMEALEDIPGDIFKECITILSNYALKGEVPDEMSPYAKMFFCMAKPQIDANSKRREAGRRGGEANGSKAEANGSKAEANGKQTEANGKQTEAKEKEKVKDKVKDKDKEKEKDKDSIPPTPLTGFGKVMTITETDVESLGVEPALSKPVASWIRNRAAKGQALTEDELKSLVSMVKASTMKYGAKAVSDLIEENMASGYKGITWNKLEQKARDAPQKSFAQQIMEIKV